MKCNIAYPNENLGKNGWFYWMLVPLLLGPIGFVLIFSLSIMESGFSSFEKLIILFGIAFFLYYLLKGVYILRLGARTAKEIYIRNGAIEIRTYLGTFHVLQDVVVKNNFTEMFDKKYLQLLYPLECEVLSVVHKEKEYYLPVKGSDSILVKSLLKN
ncbi:hypothetical protein ACFL3U_05110 [Pseudomonadota bacterium]